MGEPLTVGKITNLNREVRPSLAAEANLAGMVAEYRRQLASAQFTICVMLARMSVPELRSLPDSIKPTIEAAKKAARKLKL